MMIRIRDPERHQNLVICALAHCQPSLKVSCKSVQTFLRKVANGQTNRQRRLHILLGGGNIYNFIRHIGSHIQHKKAIYSKQNDEKVNNSITIFNNTFE